MILVCHVRMARQSRAEGIEHGKENPETGICGWRIVVCMVMPTSRLLVDMDTKSHALILLHYRAANARHENGEWVVYNSRPTHI